MPAFARTRETVAKRLLRRRAARDYFTTCKCLGRSRGLVCRSACVRRRRCNRRGRGSSDAAGSAGTRERKSIARFLGENSRHGVHRHRDFLRRTVEARGELDPIVVDRQPSRRAAADIEHDLAVLDVSRRNARLCVHLDGKIRRQTVVRAPLADGANQIRLGGLFRHGKGYNRARDGENPRRRKFPEARLPASRSRAGSIFASRARPTSALR